MVPEVRLYAARRVPRDKSSSGECGETARGGCGQRHHVLVSTLPDAATRAREPLADAAGRYAAAVLALMGIGAILNVVLGAFMEPMTWGGMVGFCLLAGGVNAGFELGSAKGCVRRRRVWPLALGGFAVYEVVRSVAKGVGLGQPPSGAFAVAMGAGALAISALVTTRLSRQIHADPATSRTQPPSEASPSA